MKQLADSLPTANIAVNKSRLKVYNKNSDIPTFYLQKGQEFQIELFNPTKETILAKISLNNKAISQGGLILRPGERVWLERYLDVAKKFKFDTYEVANTKAAQKAIEDNGDFKVEFYNEQAPRPTVQRRRPWDTGWTGNDYFDTGVYGSTTLGNDLSFSTTSTKIGATHDGSATMDWMGDLGDVQTSVQTNNLNTRSADPTRRLKSKKSIETGRVEQGSHSDQKFKTVDKSFEYFPFLILEYKLLPASQKVNTSTDVKIKKYCVECGTKQKPTNKFCPSCGTKV